jgi:hypothetical protein
VHGEGGVLITVCMYIVYGEHFFTPSHSRLHSV